MLRLFVDFLCHPILFFRRTKRTTPPDCLLDPTLGRHEYVVANDIKFHYVTCGDESKPLMLFLHGFPEFWFSWRHQIKEFSHDYHVVAVDLRGFGETDRPPNILDYSITNLRQDIVELIPSLGHSKAILVAHDWGGAIAWTVTQKHPELVEKLVVMNCPHPKIFAERIRHFSQMMKSWYMFLFQIPWLPEFILSVKDFVNFNEFFRGNSGGVRNKASFTEEDVEAYKYVFSQEGAITPPLNYYRAAMRSGGIGTDNEDDSTINVPTLIIWGDADKYFDVAMANDHGGVVSKLTVRHIPDCSHWVQNDVPETVHRYMWEFL